ncbi:MAG: PEP-CTERM sorting domain-containing protein [Bryobacterales bacterium]|nr:PEP-CTERM sorting domain-containing protein [Bryobacterales bacterium]
MDFVQRAKALIQSAASTGALKILPLAAAVAMSLPGTASAANFEAASAFGACEGASVVLTALDPVAGITGLKMSTSGSCFASGPDDVFTSVVASGNGSGIFPNNVSQLAVTFEFTGFAFLDESPTDYDWTLTLLINQPAPTDAGLLSDPVMAQKTGNAQSGQLVSSNTEGALMVDLGPLQGQAFENWSLSLLLAKTAPESFIDLSVDIPNNSIDINAVDPGTPGVPEPGTMGLLLLGGVAYLVRRRVS